MKKPKFLRNPLFRRPGSPRAVHPRLRMANQLFNNGRYQEAGELFEQIAAQAESEDRPNAHHFYYFASRAKSMDGDDIAAIDLIRKCLSLLIRDKRLTELDRVGIRVTEELIERDRSSEASLVREFLRENNIELSQKVIPSDIPKYADLPTFCPNCGATIYQVGIERLNKKSVLCNYCMTPFGVEPR